MTGSQVVGRETEREVIEHWLNGERPASLLIDGEAGIGKSTLWSYAVEQAMERGDLVLLWRASIAEHSLAYAALNALLDQPIVTGILAQLADPRRRALQTALGRVAPASSPPEPSLVGMAVTDVFGALADSGPLVVAVDDVQWSDQASEAALAFAARRLRAERVGFVLARRSGGSGVGPRDTQAHGASAGRPRARRRPARAARGRTDVRGRARPTIARAARGGLSHRSSCASTTPVPATRSSAWRSAAPWWPVAPSLPEASRSRFRRRPGPSIRDHLAGLSRDARRGLVVVAMSPEPTLALIERVLGEAGARAIDEGFEKGVLALDGQRLVPAHPLYTSTAYADSPPGERRALRQALAAIAEDPVERALHLAAATDGSDVDIAGELSDAARVASARGAPGVAAALLDRAAQVVPSATDRARYLIGAAEAAVAAGDPDGAAATLRTVLSETPRGRLRAEALLALGEVVYVEQPNEALPLLVAALDQVQGDPILEATAHAYIASMADMDPVAGYGSAMAAVEVLERRGVQADPDQLACALLDRAFHLLLAGERVAADDIDRGLGLMTGSGTSFFVRRAQEVAERCLFHLGRLAEAIALDEAEHRRLTERGNSASFRRSFSRSRY